MRIRILQSYLWLINRDYTSPDPAQVHRLIHELQALAKESGHARPLMIGIDQENGEYPLDAGALTYIFNRRFAGLVSAFSSPSVGTQLYVAHSRTHNEYRV